MTKKCLDSKHVLKPSRKNKDFSFLPVPILSGWLKILKLIAEKIFWASVIWALQLSSTYQKSSLAMLSLFQKLYELIHLLPMPFYTKSNHMV